MRKGSEIKIGEYTLNEILERHSHWLNRDCDGWENMKADLRYADLHNANLSYTDLREANLCFANLSHAFLREANLSDVNLSYANLSYANLRYANLYNANLCDVDLHNADLCFADLSYINLYNANLSYTNFSYTNLHNSNLHNTNLHNAIFNSTNLMCTNLRNTNLCNAKLDYVNLCYAKNIPFVPLACPSEGAFTAWKKVEGYLVKLEIPANAKRSSATTHKCRASEAKVLGIYTLDGKKTNLKNILNTNQDSELDYVVGETIYPDSFDDNRWNECSHGIHFFIDKQDAIKY